MKFSNAERTEEYERPVKQAVTIKGRRDKESIWAAKRWMNGRWHQRAGFIYLFAYTFPVHSFTSRREEWEEEENRKQQSPGHTPPRSPRALFSAHVYAESMADSSVTVEKEHGSSNWVVALPPSLPTLPVQLLLGPNICAAKLQMTHRCSNKDICETLSAILIIQIFATQTR